MLFGGKKRIEPKNPEINYQEQERIDDEEYDKMLNTPGFSGFLTKHIDKNSFVDSLRQSEIFEVFKKFQEKEFVSSKITELYSREITGKLGVKVGQKELGCVDAFLEDVAFENPEQISSLKSLIEIFESYEKEIKKLEGILKETERQGIDKKMETISRLKRDGIMKKFFCKESREKDLKELGIKSKEIGAESRRLSKLAKNRDELQEAKSFYVKKVDGLGTNFLALSPELSEQIREIVLEKVKEKIDNLGSEEEGGDGQEKKGIGDIEKTFEKIKSQSIGLGGGVDILDFTTEELESINTDDFEKAVEKRLEKTIKNAVESNQDNLLSSLERKLNKILTAERIGTKSGEEARAFILEKIESFGQNTENKTKKLLLYRIWEKYSKNKYKKNG